MDRVTTTADHTIGGRKGHLIRRAVHISMLVYPFLYYFWGAPFVRRLGIDPAWVLWGIFSVIVIAEVMRLAQGWVVFGQRHHEARHISSLAWAGIAVVLVLLFAPGPAYGIALVASCALVDPLLGELRVTSCPRSVVFVIGIVAVGLIWWGVLAYFGGPLIWAIWMAPLTILTEWPVIPSVDDNALMQLVPLAVLLLVGV